MTGYLRAWAASPTHRRLASLRRRLPHAAAATVLLLSAGAVCLLSGSSQVGRARAAERPAPDPGQRVGDAERDQAVSALTRHAVDGRITLAEHAARTADALTARTHADLEHLVADLPDATWPPRPTLPQEHK